MNEVFGVIKSIPDQAVLVNIQNAINDPANCNLSFYQKIDKLEEIMLQEEQLDIPVEHTFADGLYIRQIFLPKGSLVTSKYHKIGQFDVMLSGSMSILTETGIKKISAPYYKMSKAGLKRFVYVTEDVVWLDVRVMPRMEIAKAEKLLYAESYKELQNFKITESKKDFLKFLSQASTTSEAVQEASENLQDQIQIDLNYYGLVLADSPIDKKGIFTVKMVKPNEVIGPGRIGGFRTQLGRYINHSSYPNAVVVEQGKDVYFVATQIIQNEEITINYRQALELSGINVGG